MHNSIRVAFLAHALFSGGAKQVGRNLLNNINTISKETNIDALYVVPHNSGYERIVAGEKAYHYRRFPGLTNHVARFLYDNLYLKMICNRCKPQAVVGLGNHVIRCKHAKHFVLLHQPRYWYNTNHYGNVSFKESCIISMQKSMFKSQLIYIDCIFAQTQTALKRIKDQYKYKGPAIIIPNVPTEILTTSSNMDGCVAKLMSSRRIKILCLSEYYPHKNIDVLIDVAKYHQNVDTPIQLITTVSPNSKQARKYLKKCETIDKHYLVNVGRIPYDAIAQIYERVDALILPTLLESFSGTYVEAMQYQKPIVTSDYDFAHDVCGDAAEYFDPHSVASICSAIQRALIRKDELVSKGTLRLKQMNATWESNARLMIDTIKSHL